jgi:hypothetical protein
VENADLLMMREDLPPDIYEDALPQDRGRTPERWVLVTVEEAYIHCSKHIPLLQKVDKAIHWGTDDARHKGGDYFRTKTSRRKALAPQLGTG